MSKNSLNLYTEKNIIEDFKKGYSLLYITNKYMNAKNLDKGRLNYVGDHYIINNNYFTKEKCLEIVQKTIYDYLKGGT